VAIAMERMSTMRARFCERNICTHSPTTRCLIRARRGIGGRDTRLSRV